MIRGLIILCVLSLFAFQVETCLSKPLPPEGLNDIIGMLSELEESYESGEWDAAAKIAVEIEEGLNSISKNISVNDKVDFSSPLKGLYYGIEQKKENLTERSYIRLKNEIFKFVDLFQYDTHPIISIINKYIGEEAIEAAKEGNFDGVTSEIREVANILENSKDILVDNGATDKEIQEFHKKLNNVVFAARSKNKKAVTESIVTAKEYFLSLYN